MNEIVFKGLKIDLDLKICYVNNQEVNLTKTEYNLLLFLIENKDKIFTRKEIINNIQDSKVSLRSIDTVISRLRKKLGIIGNHIITRQGFGYGFRSLLI